MLNFNAISALVWAITVFLIVVIAGTIILLRKLDDKRLIILSLFACFTALVFAPLVRALPEEVSLLFFLIGLWPSLGVVAVSVTASLMKAIQTRSRHAVLSLVLGALATGLFYINATSPWIWPYRTY